MIYLDNAATTKPIAIENTYWGNASSLYKIGRKSHNVLTTCKKIIGNFFNVDPNGVIFTSGATESNNWVIRNNIESVLYNTGRPHVMTSPIEHPSVRNVIKYYEDKNLVDVTYLKVDKNGRVIIDELEKQIRKNTCLVTCMAVNNEIGSIQPIEEIGEICVNYCIPFHVDATQGIGKMVIDMKKDKIDFLSFSAHKFNGPKGVGALVYHDTNMLEGTGPFILGGHQQQGYRAGTENVDMIMSMTAALIKKNNNLEVSINNSKMINQYMEEKLKELFNPEDYIINSHDYTIPVFNVSFKNISGEYIVSELDKKDIYVSTGSACTSGDLAPSYVLEAINCPSEYIQGTIRISFDPMENTIDEINMVFHELQKIIKN